MELLSSNSEVLGRLSEPRRRAILEILQNRTSPVTTRELATHLVAEERDKPLVDVTRYELLPVRRDLVHSRLPQLEDADLIRWDRAERTVDSTDHPALSDPEFRELITLDAQDRDLILECLANGHRRMVLSVLEDREGSMARTALAKEVLARQRGGIDVAQPTDTADELLTVLHHVHLPKLQQAGLVDYETDDGTVIYEGHPALEEEWIDSRIGETSRAVLPDADRSNCVWSIEGRDSVIARGQSLFEQADEELFLMFTTDGLLEEGCIRRLQDAVDRGVDIYLGSQTRAVRDLVRERIPEAVIWEPQMDWLNLPPDHEKVGRLVFADREAIMLATLGGRNDSGTHRETAISGEGQNNPFVILIRDMLGSRLDHLDAQSEDFLAEIPL